MCLLRLSQFIHTFSMSNKEDPNSLDRDRRSSSSSIGSVHDQLLKSKSDQTILSKKKGKQKVGPELPGVLIIKFSEISLEDLKLEIANLYEYNVPRLRQEIRRKVGGITLNRRMRLIHGGKVLTDKTDLVKDVANIRGQSTRKWLEVDDKDSQSVITSLEASPTSTEVSPSPIRLFLHCSLGNILTPQELQREDEMETEGQHSRNTLPELRGFDRLRETGFSEEDIMQLRQQFGQLYGYGATGTNGNPTVATNREEMTQMEEQWIDTGVMDTLPGTTSLVSGDYIDDMIGFLVGMFLGVVALFILKEGGVFSRRQLRAVATGTGFNLLFGILRLLA